MFVTSVHSTRARGYCSTPSNREPEKGTEVSVMFEDERQKKRWQTERKKGLKVDVNKERQEWERVRAEKTCNNRFHNASSEITID